MGITLIIFNYNYERFLPKLFNSIKESFNSNNINIFFCDDLSTDNSLKIVNEFIKKNNINNMVIVPNVNKLKNRRYSSFGQIEGIQNVIDNYSTKIKDYIVFIDSDDWVEENFFEKLLIEISNNINGHELFFNDLRDSYCYENTPILKQTIKRPVTKIKNKIWPTIVPTSGIVIKKDLLLKYHEKLLVKNKFFSDVWIDSRINMLAINLIDKVKYTDIVVYRYMHGSNDSLNFNLKRTIGKQIQASKYFDYIVDKKLKFNFRKFFLETIEKLIKVN